MKGVILYLSLFFLMHFCVSAQDSLKGKPCIDFFHGQVNAYIPGGSPDSTISKSKVQSGFSLMLNDTSYQIVHFFIVFEHGEDLVQIASDGNTISPNKGKFSSYLGRIEPATLLTVESIMISKKDKCYKLSPLVYQIKE